MRLNIPDDTLLVLDGTAFMTRVCYLYNWNLAMSSQKCVGVIHCLFGSWQRELAASTPHSWQCVKPGP